MKLTKKQLKESGAYREVIEDSYGIRYEIVIFAVLAVHARVYDQKGSLIWHREMVFPTYKVARAYFIGTLERIGDNSDPIHHAFASRTGVSYQEVKKDVADWIAYYQRPMNLGDAQIISDKYANRNLAMEHVYTAACYFANCPSEADFARRNNFRVTFAI